MNIIIQIDETFLEEVDPNVVEQALATTFQRFEPNLATTISLVITNSETVQQFNHQYRGINAPTDVLSFENTPDPDFPGGDQVTTGHLGDIIIAYPVAKTQALKAGHTPQEEVMLLAVHGALHLLGFDHDTPENKKEMWTVQEQVMRELRLVHVQPTEK